MILKGTHKIGKFSGTTGIMNINNFLVKAEEMSASYLLGCGYDVFGEYADISSVGDRIIKENVLNSKPYHPINETKCDISYGKTERELSETFNFKTKLEGNHGFFSGSVSTCLTNTNSTYKSNAYSVVDEKIERFHYKLNGDLLSSEDNFTDIFIKSLKDIDSQEKANAFFERYGTHILCSFIVGGIARYECSTDLSKYKNSVNYETAAKASFAKKVGIETSGSYGKAITEFEKHSTIHISTRGGSVEYGGRDLIDNFKKWRKSLAGNDYLDFIDFINKNSLKPLYELTFLEEKKKRELRKFYDIYAMIAEISSKRVITDIEVLLGNGHTKPEPSEGYNLITDQLTRSSKANTFISYLNKPVRDLGKNNQNSSVISELKDGSSIDPEKGFKKVNGKVNGKKEIDYVLWMKTKEVDINDPIKNYENAIKNIMITSNDKGCQSTPANYVQLKKNCTSKKGKKVYINYFK